MPLIGNPPLGPHPCRSSAFFILFLYNLTLCPHTFTICVCEIPSMDEQGKERSQFHGVCHKITEDWLCQETRLIGEMILPTAQLHILSVPRMGLQLNPYEIIQTSLRRMHSPFWKYEDSTQYSLQLPKLILTSMQEFPFSRTTPSPQDPSHTF